MAKEDKLEEALERVRNSLKDFSREEVVGELEKLLEYGVPPDQAATTVVRRRGSPGSSGEKRLAEVTSGDRGLTVRGRVLDVRERTIQVSGEDRDIVSGSLGDETGVLSLTSWVDFPFDEGDAVHVTNAYAREWRGKPELQIGDYTEVEEAPGDELPPLEDLSSPADVSIEEASEVYRPRVEATIVDVLDRSGLVMRCPECNRVTEGGECSEHGEVEAAPDLRVKAVMDDGDYCIQATFPREVTEELIGITLDEAEEMAKKAMDRGVVQREMERAAGGTVIVTGRVLGDNFVVDEVERPSTSPRDEAEKLMEVLR